MTISRGTTGGGGMTRLGSGNLLMAYVHIGHDSQVGSHCILANCATLAGHVVIEDHVTLGAFCPVHQHCVVGAYAFIGGGTIVTQDVLPFSLTSSRRENKAFGINKIGLERRGFTPEQMATAAKGIPAAAARQAEHHAGGGKDAGVGWRRRGAAGGVYRAQRARGNQVDMKLGLIAGNGRFPFLLLDAARAQGLPVVVAAIKEETDPEMDRRAEADPGVTVHWLSLGELSRLIETFKDAGVEKAVMAGQVKHKQIFSSIRPDWRLAKLLLNLRTRSTDALLGAVAKVLGDEGIELMSSTAFLEPLLAEEGVLTERSPDEDECLNIEYGLGVARALAGFDIGQTVVVAAQACVAVEAMEGTDAAIERAGRLMESLDGGASTLERRLTIVKVAKPNQDMRFDVPVIGQSTVETMIRAGASCLSIEAGRTLLFDREALLTRATQAGIAIVAAPR